MAVTVRTPSVVGELLARGQLRMLFQPIVDLEVGVLVGYEALARGVQGTDLEAPAALFAAARRENLAGELDRACRERAVLEAAAAGLPSDQLLFINVEPAWLESGAVLDQMAESELQHVSVVVELTERALGARPSEVLSAVRWLRERGCRIALDDVGTDHRSLALMPFLSPDVIKLDRSIVQGQLPGEKIARTVNAVAAEAERSGAVLLAEGIERPEQLVRARSMGATLGQGWLLGRPAPLAPVLAGRSAVTVPSRQPVAEATTTPFELLAESRRTRRGDKRLLLSLSLQLEQEALGLRSEAVVISTFQHADFFTSATRRRYERLAEHAAFVGALGVGIGAEPARGVRGAGLDADDPLRGEWDVIIVGPHFAGAFVARDCGDRCSDLDRSFDFVVTYDRGLVVQAAQTLLHSVIRSH